MHKLNADASNSTSTGQEHRKTLKSTSQVLPGSSTNTQDMLRRKKKIK